MFPGGAHAKYRDRHTDCRPSNLSGGFERFRLLREDGRRQVSQLPDEHALVKTGVRWRPSRWSGGTRALIQRLLSSGSP